MPKPRNPIVGTLNISVKGFRRREKNSHRIRAASELIKLASKSGISCLFYPSGYLLATNESEIPKLVSPLVLQAQQSNLSFVAGVDLQDILHSRFFSANSPAMRKAVATGKIPCFLCAYSHELDLLTISRQRSCTSDHFRSRLVPDKVVAQTRIISLDKSQIQLVHCGECYDERLFVTGKPRAAVIFGHTTMARLTRTMQSRSLRGFSILNTEHRAGEEGMLFHFDNGKDKSVRSRRCYVNKEEGLFIDMATWELNEHGRFKASSRFPKGVVIADA